MKTKRYDFNANHPEEQEHEVFLGNFTIRHSKEILYPSKRLGKISYSGAGEVLTVEKGKHKLYPVFAKIHDINLMGRKGFPENWMFLYFSSYEKRNNLEQIRLKLFLVKLRMGSYSDFIIIKCNLQLKYNILVKLSIPENAKDVLLEKAYIEILNQVYENKLLKNYVEDLVKICLLLGH